MTEVQRARERLEEYVFGTPEAVGAPMEFDGPRKQRVAFLRLLADVIQAVRVETPPF